MLEAFGAANHDGCCLDLLLAASHGPPPHLTGTLAHPNRILSNPNPAAQPGELMVASYDLPQKHFPHRTKYRHRRGGRAGLVGMPCAARKGACLSPVGCMRSSTRNQHLQVSSGSRLPNRTYALRCVRAAPCLLACMLLARLDLTCQSQPACPLIADLLT